MNRSQRRVGIALAAALGVAWAAMRPQDPPQDPRANQLAAERHEAARQVWQNRVQKRAWETIEECETRVSWSRRLAEAAAQSGAMPARDAFAAHVARVEEMMDVVEELQKAGRRDADDVALVRFHLAEARAMVK